MGLGGRHAAAPPASASCCLPWLPPLALTNCSHPAALACAAESQDLSRLAESGSCLVLRLDTEEAAEAWYRRLQASQQAMAELAGEAGPLPDWEESSSTVSGADAAPEAPEPVRCGRGAGWAWVGR